MISKRFVMIVFRTVDSSHISCRLLNGTHRVYVVTRAPYSSYGLCLLIIKVFHTFGVTRRNDLDFYDNFGAMNGPYSRR